MSTYSENPEAESLTELFYKKIIYNNDSKTGGYSNLTDFNFGEKFLYGRVTPRFVPMEANFGRYGTKGVSNKEAQQSPSQVINFVADAFMDLSQQFQTHVLRQQIDTTDTFLSTLKVYKAYEKPQVLYQGYQGSYITAFEGRLRGQSTKIENFDHFIKELMRALKGSARTFPFTYPGYIKSRQCPISVSGLAIEIANLDPNNDQEKIDNFIQSNNWEFYLNACRSCGFMVDRHIPWRIVADIGSSPMIEYAANYATPSTTAVFINYYAPAYLSYYEGFKERLLIMYNRIKPAYITKTEECQGTTVASTVQSANYSLSYLKLAFPEEFFLETYFRIRFMEEESHFSEVEKKLLIDDLLEINASQSALKAVEQFEQILNKPFDYRGSLSYIINRNKLLLETE